MNAQPILQAQMPRLPWHSRGASGLPGTQLLDLDQWITVDEVYAPQMALREELLASQRDDVLALDPVATDSADELLSVVLSSLEKREDFNVERDDAECPDGRRVSVDRAHPLESIGRLVQEDFCILHPGPNGHVLVGAVLCFPASWTLSEKMGRHLVGVHAPVSAYDDNIARRVQRLFDAVHVDRPLWRVNALGYDRADLFHPRREADPIPTHVGKPKYLRSEFQTIRKLPRTGAIAFGIHTHVLPISAVSDDDLRELTKRGEGEGSRL